MSTLHYPEIALHIGGRRIEGGGHPGGQVFDPATGEVIRRYRFAGAVDLDAALAHARTGFDVWRQVPPHERSEILQRAASLLRGRADALGGILTTEQGKLLGEARAEIVAAADIFEWSAQEARRAYGRVIPWRRSNARFMVTREPIGPVVAFTPWNFPAITPARKLAGALAAGCSIVIKPSEETPATCLALVDALEQAGVPPGVISVVLGDPPEVARALLSSSVIRKVSFTGSTAAGRSVASLAGQQLQRTTLELGGHAPVIVCDDVDVEQVAALAVQRKFRNAGQICVSPTRFIVQSRIYREFVMAFSKAAGAMRVGPGTDPKSQMGPLANERRVQAVRALADDALRAGARSATPPVAASGPGFWCHPIVLCDVPSDARILHEEPFGPIVPIYPFERIEEAIAEANRLPVGLAAFAFSGSARNMLMLSEQIEAGMVALNSFEMSAPETPFGGIKDSGWGSEGGTEGLDAYLTTKAIHLNTLA